MPEINDKDFTLDSYRNILKLAKKNYLFVSYENIPWEKNFILWRHDCDFSLNRAHALAIIEAEEGIKSTYFLNPHCEFYNLFEHSQYRIVADILGMGHQIGLHFDSAFYSQDSQKFLNEFVRMEADLLENLFKIRPKVFSFHNPTSLHLSCEDEFYGGLLNCYSKRFKTEVPYCSDSNGYWRFRRLQDVLTNAEDKCLQILTHPDWWQDSLMPPRQKIFRCIYGRALAAMKSYDEGLQNHQRQNLNGASEALNVLKLLDPPKYQLLDTMWMNSEFQILFLELIRLLQTQLVRLCKVFIVKKWTIQIDDVNDFFYKIPTKLNGLVLFSEATGELLHEITAIKKSDLEKWLQVQHQLSHGFEAVEYENWEAGCILICLLIKELAAWGEQAIGFNGVENLTEDLINKDSFASQTGLQLWNQFMSKFN
jgi:hypothetical protein